MILHDLTPGMHPRRVRILLAEKGVAIERREVDAMAGANAAPAFRTLNPLGKLPVLELDDGSTISESLAICRYLDALHPEPPLMGRSPRARALETMAWLDRELAERSFIAGSHYSMADIVAQCALVLGKAVALRPPPELGHLSRWFSELAARPTARA